MHTRRNEDNMGAQMITRVSLALLSASTANAGISFEDGNELFAQCSSPENSLAWGVCYGMIGAYFEALTMGFECKSEKEKITRKQLVDVVMKAYREKPLLRDQDAVLSATAALTNEFDCRPNKK